MRQDENDEKHVVAMRQVLLKLHGGTHRGAVSLTNGALRMTGCAKWQMIRGDTPTTSTQLQAGHTCAGDAAHLADLRLVAAGGTVGAPRSSAC